MDFGMSFFYLYAFLKKVLTYELYLVLDTM